MKTGDEMTVDAYVDWMVALTECAACWRMECGRDEKLYWIKLYPDGLGSGEHEYDEEFNFKYALWIEVKPTRTDWKRAWQTARLVARGGCNLTVETWGLALLEDRFLEHIFREHVPWECKERWRS